MLDPFEMALQAALRPNDLDPTVARWMSRGWATFLRGASLEDAFNLHRTRADRDAHIRMAAGYLSGSPWNRATGLVSTLRALRTVDPGKPGCVATHLRLAAKCWRMPRSQRSFYRILNH